MSSPYQRLCTMSINEVVPLIKDWKLHHINIKGYKVSLCGHRLRLFAKNTTCVQCGLKASFFAVERCWSQVKTDQKPHLNLYGYDKNGKEVLFTKDHIIPLSKGGPDSMKNLQTMCSPCNCKKGNGEPQPRACKKRRMMRLSHIDTISKLNQQFSDGFSKNQTITEISRCLCRTIMRSLTNHHKMIEEPLKIVWVKTSDPSCVLATATRKKKNGLFNMVFSLDRDLPFLDISSHWYGKYDMVKQG